MLSTIHNYFITAYQKRKSSPSLFRRSLLSFSFGFLYTIKGLVALHVKGRKVPLQISTKEKYLLTSEKGVYFLNQDSLHQLVGNSFFSISAYGITIANDNTVYIAFNGFFGEHISMIYSVPLNDLLNCRLRSLKKIYEIEYIEHGSRVHQIAVDNRALYITNPANNTILKINRFTGEYICEIAPFLDQFDTPITRGDHNHINSVSIYGDNILFVAFRGGEESIIGVIGKEEICLYAYKNKGVHDIYIYNRNVYFFDTFNKKFLENDKVLNDDINKVVLEFTGRGLAGDLEEYIIGDLFSSKDRSKRFLGKGNLILVRKQAKPQVQKLPFSQLGDIIRLERDRFSKDLDEDPDKSFEATCRILQKAFGKPIRKVPLTQAKIKV